MPVSYERRAANQVRLHPTDISRVSYDPQRKSQPFHVLYSAGRVGLANHAITVDED